MSEPEIDGDSDFFDKSDSEISDVSDATDDDKTTESEHIQPCPSRATKRKEYTKQLRFPQSDISFSHDSRVNIVSGIV